MVADDTIIVGAAHRSGGVPRSKTNVKGFVRAFDVTHRQAPVDLPHHSRAPASSATTPGRSDSADYTGNAGVWGQISVDEQLGLAYLPVELPTGDYYGGHRPGNGLFGESIVAVDLKTGVRKWHYQLVHHGIWDFDIPCAPILVDITVNGRPVKAVAQPTKQAFLYVFDRATGQPIWPIDEKPVEQWHRARRKDQPTQPFPSKPPAYDRQGFSLDDLIDFTPELNAQAREIVSHYQHRTDLHAAQSEQGRRPHRHAGLRHGVRWNQLGGRIGRSRNRHRLRSFATLADQSGAGALRSQDQRFPLHSRHCRPKERAREPAPAAMEPRSRATPTPRASACRIFRCIKPPYGQISAIDLNKGEILWQVANGETPDAIRNHPALKGLNIPRTGRAGIVGVIVTKTLVIGGEAGTITMPDGKKGAYLRAYDKKTGQDAGAIAMPAGQTGSPMTYMLNGKQYIVVAVGAAGYPAEYRAYRLPN